MIESGAKLRTLLAVCLLVAVFSPLVQAQPYWTTKASMLTGRSFLATVAEGTKIYALGGCSPATCGTLNEVYDVTTNTWTTAASLPVALWGLRAVAPGNGKIYVVGGSAGGTAVNSLWEYTPSTNTWASRAPMATQRYGHAAVAVNGKIYAIGGVGPLASVEEYNPATNTWATRASMPTARAYFGAAAVNGKIYAASGWLGGTLTTNIVEQYDVGTNTWSAAASLPVSYWTSAAAAINGKVYLFGGRIPFGIVNNVQSATYAYDPSANTWQATLNMPTARDATTAAVVNGTAYIAGGSNSAGDALSVHEAFTPAAVSSPIITSSTLPGGQVGVAYAVTLAATNGTTPYSWTVTGGVLPSGLTLNTAGLLTGIPGAVGLYSFVVQVTDAFGFVGSASLQIQIGIGCITTPGTSSLVVPPAGGSGSIPVNSTCAWTASSNSAWLAVTPASGNGSAQVNYTAQPNTTSHREATITIAGQPVLVTQDPIPASCVYSLSETSKQVPAAGLASGSFTVTVSGNCSWNPASSDPSWLIIQSGGNGSIGGQVTFSAAANTTGNSRQAAITIGNVSYTVTQAGTSCSSSDAFSLSPTVLNFSDSAASGSIALQTGSSCTWTAVSSKSWVTITSGASGIGSGAIAYTVAANPAGSASRSATITAGGKSVAVNQAAQNCTYSVPVQTLTLPAAGMTVSTADPRAIVVSAGSGCQWSSSSNVPWLSINQGTGQGNGSVSYTVSANSGQPRPGTLVVAGRTINVTQQGAGTSLSCVAGPNSVIVRADGNTELASDMFVTCTGQTTGAIVTDVVFSANTQLTGRLDRYGLSETLLLVGAQVYRGIPDGYNRVRFPNVTIAGAAGSINTALRVTNIRVNARALVGSYITGTLLLKDTPLVSNPGWTLAMVSTGMNASIGTATTINAGNAFGVVDTLVPLTYSEAFSSAFKPRGATVQDPAGSAGYTTESGYANVGLYGAKVGYADTGTRLMARVSNVPAGVRVFASITDSSSAAQLVSQDANGTGATYITAGNMHFTGTGSGSDFQEIQLTNGSAAITWELRNAVSTQLESSTFHLVFERSTPVSQGEIATYLNGGLTFGPQAAGVVPQFQNSATLLSPALSVKAVAGSNVTANAAVSSRTPVQIVSPRVPVSCAEGETLTWADVYTTNNSPLPIGSATVGGNVDPGSQIGQGCISADPDNPDACQTSPNTFLDTTGKVEKGGVAHTRVPICTPAGGVPGKISVTSGSGTGSASAVWSAPPPGCGLDRTGYDVPVTGGQYLVTVIDSDACPKVEKSVMNVPSWMQYTPMSIENKTTITVEANGTGADRSQTIYVSDYPMLFKQFGTTPTVCTGCSITATPNPIPVCDASGLGQTIINWTAPGISAIEIHIGSPSGQVLVAGGSTGSQATGKWVTSGMAFYLQDVTGGKPLTAANTLATVTVSLGSCPVGGTITYSPTTACDTTGTGAGTVTWTSTGTTAVEIHLGSPTGDRFLSGVPSGSQATGKWVVAGTTFYLQDVSNGKPLTAANTLATTTVSAPCVGNGARFVPMAPCRVVDTRAGQGTSGAFGPPIMAAGATRTFPIPSGRCTGIPLTASAYSLNVTVVPPGPLSYLTAWPTGKSKPNVSTLNSDNGRVLANAAIVPAGTNGGIDVFVLNATDVIIDINGYFDSSDPGALAFYSLTPCRVADTRNVGNTAIAPNSSRDFAVWNVCGVPSSARAYSMNFTAVPSSPLGFLTTWGAGTTQPFVSTLNSANGSVVANAALVPAGPAGGVAVYMNSATSSHVVIDVNGYFGPTGAPGALKFYPLTPCRMVDTRPGYGKSGEFGPPSLGAGTTRSFGLQSSGCGIPAAAQAYALNVTVVPQGPLSYLTLWPTGLAQPTVSTLNAPNGNVVANAAIVPAGTGGAVSVFVTNPADVLLDVMGYFAP